MGVESASYISGLTASWPASSEPKNQGDDHLRLIKSVLQSTFPTATKPFYFPKSETISTNTILDATDQNNIVLLDTAAGDFTVTLPTLGSGDYGFSLELMKASGDYNGAVVYPPSGVIVCATGAITAVRVGVLASAAKFMWVSGNWYCSKPGPSVGSTEIFDGGVLPIGYLELNGGTFPAGSYPDLYAALGTTTLRDKRGRVDIGSGTGSGLTARTLGATYGAETVILSSSEMPSHYHVAGIYDPGHDHGITGGTLGGTLNAGVQGGGTYPGPVGTASIDVSPVLTGLRVTSDNGLDTTYSAGGGAAHANMQPSIASRKIIRAC